MKRLVRCKSNFSCPKEENPHRKIRGVGVSFQCVSGVLFVCVGRVLTLEQVCEVSKEPFQVYLHTCAQFAQKRASSVFYVKWQFCLSNVSRSDSLVSALLSFDRLS